MTPEELQALIAQGEGQRLDFKRGVPSVKDLACISAHPGDRRANRCLTSRPVADTRRAGGAGAGVCTRTRTDHESGVPTVVRADTPSSPTFAGPVGGGRSSQTNWSGWMDPIPAGVRHCCPWTCTLTYPLCAYAHNLCALYDALCAMRID